MTAAGRLSFALEGYTAVSMGVSRYIGRFAAGFALCLSSGALAQQPPLVLAPASPWVLNPAEDSCAVRRAFKAGDDEVLLELRQFGPGNGFQATLVSSTLKRASGPPRTRFDPDDAFTEAWSAYFFADRKAEGVFYTDSLLPAAIKNSSATPDERAANLQEWSDDKQEARELAVTALSVADAFERDITLQTGRLFAPMSDLRDCTDALLTRWGMDAGVQRTLTREPKPLDMATWVRRVAATYPAEQLQAEQSGMALLRLIVGPDGKPRECLTNPDAPDHDFDEAACKTVLRYGRFEPALDANGTPVEGFWQTTVYYRMKR